MNKKDNPVPSLDKKELILLECLLRSKDRCCQGESPDCAPLPSIEQVYNKIKIILQNGVETNNEQPKKCILEDKLYNKNIICNCNGNFCSQTGEQIDSIFS
jgi:hypothetical protein